jgi:hypothetical protein
MPSDEDFAKLRSLLLEGAAPLYVADQSDGLKRAKATPTGRDCENDMSTLESRPRFAALTTSSSRSLTSTSRCASTNRRSAPTGGRRFC